MTSSMTRKQFETWMRQFGYNDRNDWNHQEIGFGRAYWIQNESTGKFALIYEQGYGKVGVRYEVRIDGFDDFGCFTQTNRGEF